MIAAIIAAIMVAKIAELKKRLIYLSLLSTMTRYHEDSIGDLCRSVTNFPIAEQNLIFCLRSFAKTLRNGGEYEKICSSNVGDVARIDIIRLWVVR